MKKGLCQCGCGNPAPIASCNDKSKGWVRGEPLKYISGHQAQLFQKGEANPKFKGGVRIVNGRRQIWMPDHPLSHQNGYVIEDRLVAARIWGAEAIEGKWIFHKNGDLLDSSPENIIPLTRSEYQQRLYKLKLSRGEKVQSLSSKSCKTS